MSESSAHTQAALRVAKLSTQSPTEFNLRPGAEELAAITEELGLSGLRKLSFSGTVRADGPRDWRLDGQLGATVTQPCAVTLAPVTTRIDALVTRRYLADPSPIEPDSEEAEMPEDDTAEPLRSVIDPGAVMIEALSLELPMHPRAPGVELGETVHTEPGATPMRDEDTRPFAGLADLIAEKPADKDDGNDP